MNEKDVIIACDFSSAEETLTFLDRFGGKKPYVKIGMELYYAAGPDMVRRILERGHRVFLDLKLHDIPNTVRKAMKNLARLGVHMTNLHAAGGRKMMQAAVEGLAEGAAEAKCARPLLIERYLWICRMRRAPRRAACWKSRPFTSGRTSPSLGPAASKARFTATTASRSPRRRCARSSRRDSAGFSAPTTPTARC